jgi:hypothetical protein
MMTLGFSCEGNRFHLVVVDGFGIAADVIEGGAIKLAAEAEAMSVRQVATVREIEAENRVAGLQHCRVGRGVGLGARVRLHIDVLAAEELARAVAGQVLDDVGILATAVIAASGVALCVFIGEDRTGRLQHCFGDKVFAGNHLQPLVLAESFLVKGGGDLGVSLGEGKRHAVSHIKNFSLFSPVGIGRPSHPEVQIP